MSVGLGIAVLFASVGLIAVSVLTLSRARSRTALLLAAVAGAGLGIGALLPQHLVRAAEWIVAPGVLAALLPVHIRLLFAGKGALRV